MYVSGYFVITKLVREIHKGTVTLTFINLGDVCVSKLLHVSDLSVYFLIHLYACDVFLADKLESNLQIKKLLVR